MIINSLQFLSKHQSLELIKRTKSYLLQNGYILISAFTVDDPSFLKTDSGIKSHFERQELLKLFSDFEIVYYFEKKILDQGHASQPTPHTHGIVKVIAKKIGS